ncbi:class I SAM-dependent methyltransferase [Mycolicibacterium rufum]|uniref:Class I SAM-dependent methyltransferase n=1 Tax=Mycolicibacterium rufum TaxID=318424 RepID=A0A9X2XSJ9_9MYCO|nr:mycofactocin oligosaccharide methyltransferase MftM [Mycolicibacterium rufum]KGI70134.1 SAM-dependent methyltransferase [Mycolicibacterium rufum]MCV7069422.1 class I SAM-dependent methyltransferase [Mycolicibacterium rufum]ULP36412.1 class I SAM-dependent methyltransferase [Mycolicibacterium rufum]
MQAALLDPLAPCPRGRWSGHGVQVTRRHGPHRPHPAVATVCTPRFCVHRRGAWLTVEHDLTPGELSDALTLLLTEHLVDTGVLRGQSEFELVFTGVVRSTVDGGLSSWLRFYRNSLAALEHGDAAFAPIHAEAAAQVRGPRLIDLGSCFGFFPLRMAALGHDVLATDLSPSAMGLLDRVSTRLCRPVATLACDATDVVLPDGSADTVTALHLIEHLPTDALHAVLDEALRLARRRVVVAVPFEEQPRDCYGHVQRFDLLRLQRLADELTGRHAGITAHTYAFHGGWLVLDR